MTQYSYISHQFRSCLPVEASLSAKHDLRGAISTADKRHKIPCLPSPRFCESPQSWPVAGNYCVKLRYPRLQRMTLSVRRASCRVVRMVYCPAALPYPHLHSDGQSRSLNRPPPCQEEVLIDSVDGPTSRQLEVHRSPVSFPCRITVYFDSGSTVLGLPIPSAVRKAPIRPRVTYASALIE
jgi:hypothetical protein